jgi:hypothetical protein
MKRSALRLLAIDIASKGFGFALVEAKRGVLECGFSVVRGEDDQGFRERLRLRIERSQPGALVLENFPEVQGREKATRRRALAIRLAADSGIGICQVPQAAVREIVGGFNKSERMHLLVERFPYLARRLPRARAPWQSEDPRSNIFDAIALAVAVLGLVSSGRR